MANQALVTVEELAILRIQISRQNWEYSDAESFNRKLFTAIIKCDGKEV